MVWLLGALVVAAAVGWTGQNVQSGVSVGAAEVRFAPWLVFPLLLGAVLGGALFALMRVLQLGHRPSALAGAVPAVMVAVLLQHYAAWCDCRARRLLQQQQNPHLAAAQQAVQDQLGQRLALAPESLLAYLKEEAAGGRRLTAFWTARGVWAWLSWALDALLTMGSALAMVGVALGQPYCAACQSWYRTVRRGRLKGPAAAELVGLLFQQPTPVARAASYRLQECLGGCGPTRLTLTIAGPAGASDSGEWWLDAPGREKVVSALRQTRRGRGAEPGWPGLERSEAPGSNTFTGSKAQPAGQPRHAEEPENS